MAKKQTLLTRVTRFISWLVGSWWGVFLHVVWFGIWLNFNFSLDLLTLSVSLEAIFIGIFLLMASNEAEAARDARERRERSKDRTTLRSDLSVDEEQLKLVKSLARQLATIKQQLADIENKIS